MLIAFVGVAAFLAGWFLAVLGAKALLKQTVEAHMDAAEAAGADFKRYATRLASDSRVSKLAREKMELLMTKP